ncbi:hypothetical protein [Prochlorococcus marinus]|uniref:Uncharacterized protein n=1 Tax=Prochlorococcus marinus (strain MIT 9211) TaxID=93059 RepID=A9BCF0_PROM4|nr:hypothetical protein [Prochlorococcus marinus]ABX09512.1 conserved hypothetical protein [Prochlorococcus marinus str. MIT 9211]
MDICLIHTEECVQIRPSSIHGMLWLQTHFEDNQWEALALNQVKLPVSDVTMLNQDPQEAGLIINFVPALHKSNEVITKNKYYL